ncbi:hypothetical protein AB0B50_17445 [Streptomyces sp. NPDC041068]|uniref:hypothetical protein n=1 Tax=Streptomyces sp. NPDC041068 TaxID=3155130 RepID=UPI003403D237
MAEPRTTKYRLRYGAWGIAVDLTASVALGTKAPADAEPVSTHVWLDASPALTHPPTDRTGWRITPDEAAWLRHGPALAAPAVEARHAPRHTTVTVHRALFPLTDHQPEGLAAALLKWLEEEFELAPHPADATFDRPSNRYVYVW